jgi:hypothetical protein
MYVLTHLSNLEVKHIVINIICSLFGTLFLIKSACAYFIPNEYKLKHHCILLQIIPNIIQFNCVV